MVSALQQSSLQIGKLGTQAIVNTLGTTVIAAYSVSSRFEDYAMVPLSTIAYAMTTFIAQNIGAGTSARVRRSIFASLSFSRYLCVGLCWGDVWRKWTDLGPFYTRAGHYPIGRGLSPYHELDLFAVRPDECDAGIFQGNG